MGQNILCRSQTQSFGLFYSRGQYCTEWMYLENGSLEIEHTKYLSFNKMFVQSKNIKLFSRVRGGGGRYWVDMYGLKIFYIEYT